MQQRDCQKTFSFVPQECTLVPKTGGSGGVKSTKSSRRQIHNPVLKYPRVESYQPIGHAPLLLWNFIHHAPHGPQRMILPHPCFR